MHTSENKESLSWTDMIPWSCCYLARSSGPRHYSVQLMMGTTMWFTWYVRSEASRRTLKPSSSRYECSLFVCCTLHMSFAPAMPAAKLVLRCKLLTTDTVWGCQPNERTEQAFYAHHRNGEWPGACILHDFPVIYASRDAILPPSHPSGGFIYILYIDRQIEWLASHSKPVCLVDSFSNQSQ